MSKAAPRRRGGSTRPGLAQNLRSLRQKAKLTQQQAASLCGLSLDQWNRYENGRSQPPSYRLPLLVAALKHQAKGAPIGRRPRRGK